MKVSYKQIMDKGYGLIKEDLDVVWGTEDKDKAETIMHIAGIVDMIINLKEMCGMPDPDSEED